MNADPKQVMQRYLDALVADDLYTIRDRFAQDAVWTIRGDLPIAGPWNGRDLIVDGFLGGVIETLFEAGSHLFEFGAMIADGETIALEWHVTARSANGTLTTTTTAGSSWSAMAGSPRCASTWIRTMRLGSSSPVPRHNGSVSRRFAAMN